GGFSPGLIRWIRSSRNTEDLTVSSNQFPVASQLETGNWRLETTRRSMRIAFQGAPGAYSEMAAQRAWPGIETVPCEQFEDVFASVAEGRTSHGLLPIENSVG